MQTPLTFNDPFVFKLDSARLPALPATLDREVHKVHTALQGKRILLVISGSIAAYKCPGLLRMLRSYGAHVDVMTTSNASQFVGRSALEWAAAEGKVRIAEKLSGAVEHLENYDAYLAAPASYNFINAISNGRADSAALTAMATALGRAQRHKAQLLILPCMNGDMVNAVLNANLKRLHSLGAVIVRPRTTNGKLEYPGDEFLTVAVARALSSSILKHRNILVTAGPTPVPLDDVRRLTNIFRGRLGTQIAQELVIRGANPKLLLGGELGIPDYLKPFCTRYRLYSEYKDLVLADSHFASKATDLAILSSAVADYRFAKVHQGKIASKTESFVLPPLEQTEKVVELLHRKLPSLPIVSFKLLSRISEDELITEARRRVGLHSRIVVANRLEDCNALSQKVYLVTRDKCTCHAGSKREVAAVIVDQIEQLFSQEQYPQGAQ